MTATYKISFEAESEAQAQEKMRALVAIVKKLSAKELKKLAEIIQENGSTFQSAKQFLNL